MYIVFIHLYLFALIYLVLIILLLEDKLNKNDLISVHNFILFQVTKQFVSYDFDINYKIHMPLVKSNNIIFSQQCWYGYINSNVPNFQPVVHTTACS